MNSMCSPDLHKVAKKLSQRIYKAIEFNIDTAMLHLSDNLL